MRRAPALAFALGALFAAPSARADDPRDADGWVEVALGVGALANGAATATRERASSWVRQGTGVSGEIVAGGRIFPGLFLGGGITAVVLPPAPRVPGSATLDLVILGPAVGFHFWRGFHAELLVGAATFADAATDLLPTGTGISIGAGWETPLARRWAIGILARSDWAVLHVRMPDAVEDHRVLTGSLQVAGSYRFQ